MIALGDGLADCSGVDFYASGCHSFDSRFCGYCECNLIPGGSLHMKGVA